MIKRIAVIGATGFLGRPVTRALHDAGFQVTALIRSEKKSATIPSGITRIKGDLWNLSDLDRLLSGQDALYLSLNLDRSASSRDMLTEREGLERILSCAAKHDIRHIGFLSSLVMNYQGTNGFNWWVFDMKRSAVDKVKSCGIPSTIFYPSTFMDNFESTYRMGNKILLSGKSKHKMYFVAAADYGRQVAQTFGHADGRSREYVIQGPDGFTADEAAEVYIRHNPNKSLRISRAPLGLLKFIGKFVQSVNYGYHIIEALNNYSEKFEASQTWTELGKPQITLQEFAAGKTS